MRYIAIWSIVALLSSLVAGIVAHARGRDHSYWAAWSFLVPPMLLVLLLLPRSTATYPPRRTLDDEDREEA
jgi:hypothetical protein